jgi:hypothetical protein
LPARPRGGVPPQSEFLDEAGSTMSANDRDDREEAPGKRSIVPAQGGIFGKGIALAVGCQVAYLLFVSNLPHIETRQTGYVMFGLVQLIYLYPLAVFFQRRGQGRTALGVMAVGIVSLLAEAVWFGYALLHGGISGIPSI